MAKHKLLDSYEIAVLYEGGLSVPKLARKFGVSENSIYYHLDKLNKRADSNKKKKTNT